MQYATHVRCFDAFNETVQWAIEPKSKTIQSRPESLKNPQMALERVKEENGSKEIFKALVEDYRKMLKNYAHWANLVSASLGF